jgi:GTP-binding protein HflX
LKDFPNSVAISALIGLGIDELLSAVSEQLFEKFTSVSVHLPYQQGALISQFHELGQVERIEHVRGGVELYGKLPGRLVARYKPYMIGSRRGSEPALLNDENPGSAVEE